MRLTAPGGWWKQVRCVPCFSRRPRQEALASSICHPLTLKWGSGGVWDEIYGNDRETPKQGHLHTRGIGGAREGGGTGNTVCSGTTGSSHPPPGTPCVATDALGAPSPRTIAVFTFLSSLLQRGRVYARASHLHFNLGLMNVIPGLQINNRNAMRLPLPWRRGTRRDPHPPKPISPLCSEGASFIGRGE